MKESAPEDGRAVYILTRIGLALLVAVVSWTAQGAQYEKSEIAALPRWCHSTQTFSEEAGRRAGGYQEYLSRYGEGWSHVHHYCWALISMMRYDKLGNSAQERRGHAASALADIQYVLDRTLPDFVLWADMVMRKTRILMRERALDRAMESAAELLAAFPERADSHGLKAEVLFEAGKRGEAKKSLDEAVPRVKDPDRLKKIRSILKL